jgi:hypothetical protein
MLRTVNAEYVKLDGSIVAAAVTEAGARAVLMATFARQTGAYVIAEGIEDEDTLAFLRSIDDLERTPPEDHPGWPGLRPRQTVADDPGQPAATPERKPACSLDLTSPSKPLTEHPRTTASTASSALGPRSRRHSLRDAARKKPTKIEIVSKTS